MTKTIKEFASELNVTKQAIQYQIKKIDSKHLNKRIDGAILITLKGQRLIRENMGIQVAKDHKNDDKKSDSILSDDMFLLLQEELRGKNNQIEQLQKLIENQQVLTLQANQKIEKLELDLEDNNDELSSFPEKKKKKWTDIFKSKNRNYTE